MYPEFSVPGVPQGSTWQLFNVSNYEYYKLKVRTLLQGVCGFCRIDPKVNEVLIEGHYWRVIKNTVAPRSDKSGQEYQFVIPLRRHVENASDLTREEWSDLGDIQKAIDRAYHVTGGVLLVRSGDPAKNAKSMPHLHFNYHVPTGRKRVEITIAKSEEDLVRKLPILRAFEKMRVMELTGHVHPVDLLSPEEQALVQDKLGARGSC